MIPEEVAIIAQTLAIEYKGLSSDYEQFIGMAWRIYTALQEVKD